MERINQGFLNSIALVILVFLSGCASITGTTGENVSVETRSLEGKEVAGASCELTNEKGKWFVTTPGSVGIHRSNDDMLVTCKKAGFDAGRASVVSDIKGSMFGNILLGGGIGAIIDHENGSAYEYPTLIQIVMGSTIKIETPKPPPAGSDQTDAPTQPPDAAKPDVAPAPQLAHQTTTQPAEVTSQSTTYKKLKELDALRKDGVLTQQEFDEKKTEILKGM
jgi:hypothetical protein